MSTRRPRAKWTPEEDAILQNVAKRYGHSWERMAKTVNTKNCKQCRQRFLSYLNPEIVQEPLSIEDKYQMQGMYFEGKSMMAMYNIIKKPYKYVKQYYYNVLRKGLNHESIYPM